MQLNDLVGPAFAVGKGLTVTIAVAVFVQPDKVFVPTTV